MIARGRLWHEKAGGGVLGRAGAAAALASFGVRVRGADFAAAARVSTSPRTVHAGEWLQRFQSGAAHERGGLVVVEQLGGMGCFLTAFTTGPLPSGEVAQPWGDDSAAGRVPRRPRDRG